MSNVNSVTGANFWRDPDSEEAREARRRKGPDRVPEPHECFPEDITPRALDACTETADGAPSLFRAAPGRRDIDIDDIGQRAIGDCYLLATLGVLTRSEEGRALIRGMIRENKDGSGNVLSYTVTLHRCAPPAVEPRLMRREEVTVSASLPYQHAVTERPGVPGNRAEVWVAVIEKAYAELKGGFGNTMFGAWPGEAFEALTGKPATYVDAALYTANQLLADVRANKPMTLSTNTIDPANPYGLRPAHAYMVVGARTDAHGTTYAILKNPWGYADPAPVPIKDFGRYFTYLDRGQP
jgi:hypothetical protein